MLRVIVKGGPGCSSFDGLMMEVGPWRMDGKGGFKTMEGGWEEYTTMVYGAFSSLFRHRRSLMHVQLTSQQARGSRTRAQTVLSIH